MAESQGCDGDDDDDDGHGDDGNGNNVIIEWPESTDFTRRTQLGKIVTLPRILPISSSLRALL